MKKLGLLLLTSLATSCIFAEDANLSMATPGFFIGVGAGYNSLRLSQVIDGTATTNVYTSSGNLAAYGSAGGPTDPFHSTQLTLAPEAEIGYWNYFGDTKWFGGAKFFYEYLGFTFTQTNLTSFQSGAYTVVGGGAFTFIGHFIVDSAQTSINHELALMPLFGYSFNDKTQAYIGGGAVVFETNYNLYGVTAFANINQVTDITGAPANFYNTRWMWGGIGQIGLLHNFAPTWQIDVNYSYAVTGTNTIDNAASFSNSLYRNGSTYSERGNAVLSTMQSLITQSLCISINKIF